MGRLGSWYEHWNTVLIEKLGPPQIGAGHPEAPVADVSERPCPICGKALSEHWVERPGGQARSSTLHCPS